MEVGNYLLWMAVLAGAGSVAFSGLFLYARVPRYKTLSRLLLMASFLFSTATFILMVYYFQTSNFSIDYVVLHSRTSYDAYYKLAGVWAGGKGSLLLWTWFIGLSLAIEEGLRWRRHRKHGGADGLEVYDWIRLFASVVFVAMLYLQVELAIFARTSPAVLASPAGQAGFGLNPLLETPMVIIHPPMEFAGYALVTLPFAAALAFLVTKDRDWTDASLQWGRMAWVFYTAAIALGGIWAYTVLGWGGYWAWDPVETVNLIPWIALTAFVHAQMYNRQRRRFVWVAPALAITAFTLTFFATFQTRTGFIDSVHTFTSLGLAAAPPATEKLLLVMALEPAAPFLLVMILASLLVAAILFIWRFIQIRKEEAEGKAPSHLWIGRAYIVILLVLLLWIVLDVTGFLSSAFDVGRAIGGGNGDLGTVILAFVLAGIPIAWILFSSPEESEEQTRRGLVNDDSTMTVAVAILSLWFLVTLALLLMGVNGIEASVFESRLPLIVVPLGMTFVAALLWRPLGSRRTLILLIAIAAPSVLFAILLEPGWFWVYVPVAVAAAAIAVYGITSSIDRKRSPRELRIAGMLLIGSGIMGALMWGALPSAVSLGFAAFEVTTGMAIVGFVASMAVLSGAALASRAHNIRASTLLSVLGILAIGYVAGAILAALALTLVIRSWRKEEKMLRAPMKRIRPAVRKAAAHTIHLGVALLLLAYAASTFLHTEVDVDASKGSPSQETLGYTFELTRTTVEDHDADGKYERVVAHVNIHRNGRSVANGELLFWWTTSMGGGPHYMGQVDVTVLPLEDVYLIPSAFTSQGDGRIDVKDRSGERATSSNITDVAFVLHINPLVGVLWGGVWMMTGGMIVRVAADHWRPRRPPKHASTVQSPAEATAAEADEA